MPYQSTTPGTAASSAPMMPTPMFQNAAVRMAGFPVNAWTMSKTSAVTQSPSGMTTSIGWIGCLPRRARAPLAGDEIGDGAVEHRRRAVERDAQRDQDRESDRQRRRHHGEDQGGRGGLGDDDGADHAHAVGDDSADELAGGAAGEHQREREPHAADAEAL